MKSYRPLQLVLLMTIPFLNNALMAQTSGAVAPEVTQFEPVDTTDMVNFQSGDFSYSIPVLTIPNAPGGDFPLNLNYHAGILYDQEASWVGLGWNLTPGQITRTLRGIPDDYAFGVMKRRSKTNWTHSYNVNFGYAGWSAGVNWDNHGGFGGSVGYGFGYAGSEVTTSATWHNKHGGDVGIKVQYGPVNVYANSKGNWGAGIGYTQSLGVLGKLSGGVQYDSEGGVSSSLSYSSSLGIGLGSGGMVTGPLTSSGSSNITKTRSGASTITNQSSSYFLAMQLGYISISLGYTKARSFLEAHTYGVGFMHMDKMGVSNYANPVLGEAIAHGDDINIFVYDSDRFDDQNRYTLQNQVNVGLGRQFRANAEADPQIVDSTGRGIAVNPQLDFHTADYTGQLSQNYAENDYGDEESFHADYIATSYDLYNIAAQGLSGVAIPIAEQKSMGIPYDNLTYRASEDGGRQFIFEPYREIIAGFGRDTDWKNKDTKFIDYLADLTERLYGDANPIGDHPIAGWDHLETFGNTSYNMMMVSDFGTTSDPNLFQSDANDENPFPSFAKNVRRPSKLMHYELNKKGEIERITITKEDGIRYVFGRYESPIQTGFQAGETPQSLREDKVTASTDSLDAELDNNSAVHNSWETAYTSSWFLAAILSPDYIDRGIIGPGDEDYGAYLKFTYQTVSPNFHWATPAYTALFDYYHQSNPPTSWSMKDPINTQFSYLGRSLNEERHSWQREFGQKEIIVPLMAETKSHVAYFDVDYSDLRKDNLPAPKISWNLLTNRADDDTDDEYDIDLSKNPQQYLEYAQLSGNLNFITDSPAKIELRDAFCENWDGLEPARSWEKDLIALPIGLANRMNIKPGEVVPVNASGFEHEVILQTPASVATEVTVTTDDDAPNGCEDIAVKATIVYLGAIERTGQEYYLVSRICPSFVLQCPAMQMCPTGGCDQTTTYGCETINQVFYKSQIKAVRFAVPGGNRAAKLKSVALYTKQNFYSALRDIDSTFDLTTTQALPGNCDEILSCDAGTAEVPYENIFNDGSAWPANDPTVGYEQLGLQRENTDCTTSVTPTNHTFNLTTKLADANGNQTGKGDFRLLDFGFSKPSQQTQLAKYLRKSVFKTDYLLGSGTPNSIGGTNSARLTLQGIDSYTTYFDQGTYQEVKTSNGYNFSYYAETSSQGFDNSVGGFKSLSDIAYKQHYNRDPWGYISVPNGTHERSLPYASLVDADRFNQQVPYGDASVTAREVRNIPVQAAWSLARISTPIGADIFIEYDRDSYTWIQDLPAVVSNALQSYGEAVPASIDYTDYQNLEFNSVETESSNEIFFTQHSNGLTTDAEIRALTRDANCLMITEEELLNRLTSLTLDTSKSKTDGLAFGGNNTWITTGNPNAKTVLGYYTHSFIIARVKPEKYSNGGVRFVLPIIKDGTNWRFKRHRAVKKFANWLWTTERLGSQEKNRLDKNCEDLNLNDEDPNNDIRASFIDSMHFFSIPNPKPIEGVETRYPYAQHEQGYTESTSSQWTGGSTSGGAYNSLPYMYERRALVGEIGGGIRVKAIEMRSGTGSFAQGTYRNQYDYSDQSVPVSSALTASVAPPSSGVIFVDPTTKMYGNAAYSEDRRIVRSEMNPYYNVPGGNVVYGQVRLQRYAYSADAFTTNNLDSLTLVNTTDYQFHTSRDARILNPYLNYNDLGWQGQDSGGPSFDNTWNKTEYEISYADEQSTKPQLVYTEGATLDDTQPMAKWHLNTEHDPDANPEVNRAWWITEHEAKFLFYSHHSQKILNNTSLIGMPQSQTYYSKQADGYNPLGKTEYYYSPVFNPNKPNDGRSVLTFKSQSGLLDAVITKQYQGIVFDQTLMPLLNLTGLENATIDEYLVRTLGIDEIRNNFTSFKTKQIKYEYDRNPNNPIVFEQEEEQLAFDAYTGVPVLNVTKAKNGLDQDQYLVNISATAHQLFNPVQSDMNQSMRDQNLLSQEGWSASLMSTAVGFYDTLKLKLDTPGTSANEHYLFQDYTAGPSGTLNGLEAEFLASQHNYWFQQFSRDITDPTHADFAKKGIWLNVSAYAYNPFNQDTTADGWRQLPYQASDVNKTTWQFDFERGSDGIWMSEGVNTQYNRHQIPTEYKTRQGTYASLHTMYDERFAKAQFSNAELVQTFHEGFEESSADSTFVNEQWRDNYAFSARNGYMANFDKVYVGTRSHKLSGSSGSAMFNKPINVRQSASANDVRDYYWVSFFLKPMEDQLSFFFSFGEAPTVNNGIPIKAHTPRFQSAAADHHPPAFSSAAPQNYEIVPVDNGWFFFRAKVRVGSSNEDLTIFSSLGTVYLDEISVYPAADPGERDPMDLKSVDASVAFYGYHPHHRKVISITGANGRTLRYEFNDKGELLRSFDIEGRPIQDNYFIRADEEVFSTPPQTIVPEPPQ